MVIDSTTYVKEISNTKLLVSLQHDYFSFHMGIFDLSKKGKARKIYTFEETKGSIGSLACFQ